ncbi:MAG: AGE family epimerase/isomerase [candidate division KSB1 bacterium]|nr:AGE family epimerase/isomerase [candidate division KSB1 bacterium]MDZ7314347.1 AGE family epimerase/isomerase [candidate division KSB1 bacterium]
MRDQLRVERAELENILEHNILDYWLTHGIDTVNGGFIGYVDYHNRKDLSAPKGSVLNTRILWTFSAAYRFFQRRAYLEAANRAFDYLLDHFWDKENGGTIWAVDARGNPTNKRKQTYALAFAIYAFCEYYAATGNTIALEKALELYRLIEQHCVDRENGGYWEALGEKWEQIEDVRLSEKDANEKKSMNTHLHVLEAYANLARVWPEGEVRAALHNLIRIFLEHIIDPRHGHFNLFFDEYWNVRSAIVSFGHDIEGSWLLDEAAQVYHDADLLRQVRGYSVRLVEAALEGLDADGGLMNEKNLVTGHLDTDKHWWQQAEAMVGLLNAYQITQNENYLELCLKVWNFIKSKIIDFTNGEWYWKVNRTGDIYPNDEKIGFWKCPYHNSRACLEMMARLDRLSTTDDGGIFS